VSRIWRGIRCGEPSTTVFAQLGRQATVLPRPIDFGDGYAELVLRNVPLGGFRSSRFSDG
jgi:hypothetical protein